MAVAVFLNIITLMMEHFPSNANFDSALDYANDAFTLLFTLEATVKLMGLSWNG